MAVCGGWNTFGACHVYCLCWQGILKLASVIVAGVPHLQEVQAI